MATFSILSSPVTLNTFQRRIFYRGGIFNRTGITAKELNERDEYWSRHQAVVDDCGLHHPADSSHSAPNRHQSNRTSGMVSCRYGPSLFIWCGGTGGV